MAMALSPAAMAQYWSYSFSDMTRNGSWGEVRSFSEQKVNAALVAQNISAHCSWGGSEPNPPVSTAGPWTGTYTRNDNPGVVYPCTGSYGVTWNACPEGTRFVEQEQSCLPVKDVQRGSKPPMCGDGAGNPIYPLIGSKRERVDTQLRLGRTSLQLTYDSSRELIAQAAGATAQSTGDAPGFGALWLSNLHRRIIASPNQLIVQAYRGEGRVVSFQVNGGALTADADVNDRLISTSGGYRYIDADAQTIEDYDGAGKVFSIAYAGGQRLWFTYSDTSTASSVAPAPGYLIQVTDRFGRSLRFSYSLPTGGLPETDARVSQVTDTAGRPMFVGYDAVGNLSRLTWADTAVRQFVYEVSTLPWALTGVVDERGVRYSSFGYDSQGRAISTEHANSVDRYSIAYDAPPRSVVTEVYDSVAKVIYRYHEWQQPINPVLTDPQGSTISLGSTTMFGYPRVSTRSQPAGAGCAASTSSTGYDANGNVAVNDNFNGTRTCYSNDLGRNLETVRVEGLANTTACGDVTPINAGLPVGSRKVTTAWHPDWRLQTQQTEPNKLTTWVYNGQPDPFNGGAVATCAPGSALLPNGKPIAVLCKRVEQSTADANGSNGLAAVLQGDVAARVWQWTYNSFGQMLSAEDPLGNGTAYVYYTDTTSQHTAGDLQSVTNAAGHRSQFTTYDAAGRLLRSIAPSGAAVDTGYTARGWVNAVTVTPAGGGTALVTVYGYDPAGQLAAVQMPDGTTLTYIYDDAQRLTGIEDETGNAITYTLDNLGNRIGEWVRDPEGTLARAITRAYDALNRLQSITGAPQ